MEREKSGISLSLLLPEEDIWAGEEVSHLSSHSASCGKCKLATALPPKVPLVKWEIWLSYSDRVSPVQISQDSDLLGKRGFADHVKPPDIIQSV